MEGLLGVLAVGLAFLLVVAGLVIAYLVMRLLGVRREFAVQLEQTKRSLEQELATVISARSLVLQQEAQQVAHEQAQAQLNQWRVQELELARQQQFEIARGEAQNQLVQWRAEQEAGIRQDAIDRSRAVIAGKITEHFIPYLPDFPFNPKDARFLGTPVDMVVFDGLDEGDLKRIVFVEVKTGNSGLTSRERRIREAIGAGKLEWLELRRSLEYKATVTPQVDGLGAVITVETP